MTQIGNARLLYMQTDASQWGNWFNQLLQIDHLLASHPRFHIASNDAFLYFFSENVDSGQYWCARDVVGFDSALPPSFGTFDSFATSVYSEEVDSSILADSDLLIETVKTLRYKYKDESLAVTWRIVISTIDCPHDIIDADLIKMPKVTFQFFKSL